MRIITLNLNGIRSANRKGAFTWLAQQQADVICFQETRAPLALLQQAEFQLIGYHCYYLAAEKSGYSGVGICSLKAPDKIVTQLGFPLADTEGRYIHLEFGDLIVASIYFPSGTSGEARQLLKYEFMARYETTLDKQLRSQRPCIITGDWNIAHRPIDLKNWRANQNCSGFLPQERAWLDKLFDEKGWVDAFRVVNQAPEQYTWWSARSRTAWENNVGWRIDYQIVTPNLKNAIKAAHIYKAERFSDHAPLIMDYAL